MRLALPVAVLLAAVLADSAAAAAKRCDRRGLRTVRVTGTTGEHLLASGDDLDPGTHTVAGGRAQSTRAGRPESASIP